MKRKMLLSVTLIGVMLMETVLSGCSALKSDNVTVIEFVHYKQEAVELFEELESEFNATHDNIRLKISSPYNATTILKTRFIREDYPDIIGIGGDITYSNFVDAGILADISDYEGIQNIKTTYMDILKGLEFVPMEEIYGIPYMANAAGVLYNKDMFEEHGWEIPTTWNEFIRLCTEIEAEGIQPLYFGFKDTWTCLAPWNALAVGLTSSDVCQQVNRGNTTFSAEYRIVAEKLQQLVSFGQEQTFAYGYNDACTAFARGSAAMYTIGSYAIPQIKSVNPDLNIGSFVMPANDNEADNVLNSGIDLQFCITEACKNKEAAYEVLDFLFKDENIQRYLNEQNAISCKDGDFNLASELDGMSSYIEEGRMADFHDHYYPSEMAVDAQIQGFLLNNNLDDFLTKFDKDWKRYNRDVIRKVKEYEEEQKNQ